MKLPRRDRGDWESSSGQCRQGDTFEELLSNIYEAVEGCLSVEVQEVPLSSTDRVIEIAV